jgi:hypothetical protein
MNHWEGISAGDLAFQLFSRDPLTVSLSKLAVCSRFYLLPAAWDGKRTGSTSSPKARHSVILVGFTLLARGVDSSFGGVIWQK